MSCRVKEDLPKNESQRQIWLDHILVSFVGFFISVAIRFEIDCWQAHSESFKWFKFDEG
jgi:hypothetical protein